MVEGYRVDFDVAFTISRRGRFGEWLNEIPRHAWRQIGEDGRSLLFYACNSPSADNMRALHRLIRSGLSIHTRDECGFSVAGYATRCGNASALAILIAYGAHPRECDAMGIELIDLACAPVFSQPNNAVATLLVTNGVRLGSRCAFFPRLLALEQGRLRCRSAACALLGLKRFHPRRFRHVDRFLFRELARAVWTTLCDEKWQLLTGRGG